MYCVHAQKTALGAPKTHFRECKFPGGMLPISPHTIYIAGPPFLFLPWAPPILSAALVAWPKFGLIFGDHAKDSLLLLVKSVAKGALAVLVEPVSQT